MSGATEETVETLYLLGEEDRIVGVSGYAVRPKRVRREKPRVSAFISADVLDDFLERIREPLAIVLREPIEDGKQPLLRDRRRFLQQRAPGASQVQHEPPRVARIAVARDEARVDQPRDDDRDGALIGERARGEIVERKRRRPSELGEHEKLCTGNAQFRLRLPVGDAQHPHQAADGIEDSLAVAHGVDPKDTWDRIDSANGAMPDNRRP